LLNGTEMQLEAAIGTVPRLLVIDDSEADAALAQAYLHRTPLWHDVAVASSLSEGIDHLERSPIDCVLLDLSLPDSSDLEGVVTLRRRFPHLAIVVLTGRDDDATGEMAVRSGAQDYLSKSDLTIHILGRAVRHAIERQRQRVELMRMQMELANEVQARQAAEAQERLARNRASALIEHASDGIVVIDGAGLIISANPALIPMLGWDPADWIGRSPLQLIHPDDLETATTSLYNTLGRLGEAPPLELRLVRRDGTWATVEAIANNRLDDPAVGGVIVSVRDITFRREAEAAMRRSEEDYRRIVELANEGIWTVDVAGKTTFVNRRMTEMLGYASDEMIGHNMIEFMGESKQVIGDRYIEEHPRGAVVDHDIKFVRHDGSPLWVTLTTTPLIEDGQYAGAFAMVSDVTARRAAERALSVAKERFQVAFDNAIIGMTLLDLGGHILEVNPAFCQMMGLRETELLGTRIADLTEAMAGVQFDQEIADFANGRIDHILTERQLVGAAGRSVWAQIGVARAEGDAGVEPYLIFQAEDISARKRSEATLLHQTLHDPLTGLGNRTLLRDRMSQALARRERRGGTIALLFIDVDRFKRINDSLGHDVGDELLLEVAKRIKSAVRPGDSVIRLGGDEFVVLAEDLEDESSAEDIGERIRAAVAVPFDLADHAVAPTVSIGIAIATDGTTADLLLMEADTAMYRAKESGKDRVEIFNDNVRLRAQTDLSMERTVRGALADGRFTLQYQPIIDLRDGSTVAAEALIRLVDTDGTWVAPHDFIEIAEETGTIGQIGTWVLDHAAEQLGDWGRDASAEHLSLHVNVSAQELRAPNFEERIAAALESIGRGETQLCIELTETALLDATPSTMRALKAVTDLGVRLGIDDFGTGYSSLTYLRRFPIDFVKVDQSFVGGLPDSKEDRAIVRAVVSLARSLGIEPIAEGVETDAQIHALRELGCNLAQGFRLGLPGHAGSVLHPVRQ
jgi:diguanylate cyclase (GGDEF)-like protein/PAS domain S-box-containing protein